MLELLLAGQSGLPWTVVGATEAQGVAANSSVNFPAGYATGDAVLALVYNVSSLSRFADPPAGWQQLASEEEGVISPIQVGYLYLLNAISNQTAFQNSNFSATANTSILVLVLRPTGVPIASMPFGPVLEVASDNSTANDYPWPPDLTTTTARNQMVVVGMTQVTNAVFSAPTGYTVLAKASGTSPCVIAMCDTLQETAGVFSPSALPHNGTVNDWLAFTVSLRTQPKSGLLAANGDFATMFNDIVAQTQVASSTLVTIASEGGGTLPISISGGNSPTYRINGGAWTNATGVVSNGDVIEVRDLSLALSKGQIDSRDTTVTINNNITKTYRLTTRRAYDLSTGVNAKEETWTVPTGVTSIDIYGVGAGGGSGAGNTNGAGTYYGGGGGGGGAHSRKMAHAVSAGTIVTMNVGPRGEDGSIGVNATDGGDALVTIGGTTIVLAKGGKGGRSATTSAAGAGGAGGLASSGTGATSRYSGGSGGTGTSSTNTAHLLAGGGGGAGGYTANGGNGANGAASTTPNSSSAASGGAASGGASAYGGGGVGLSGSGTSGAASSSHGRGGSPDGLGYGADGNNTANNGYGGSAGGGAGGHSTGDGYASGGGPAVRLAW